MNIPVYQCPNLELPEVEADMWGTLIEWLESVEDSQIIKQAYSEFAAAGGRRERAGWLRWDDVGEELN